MEKISRTVWKITEKNEIEQIIELKGFKNIKKLNWGFAAENYHKRYWKRINSCKS